MYYGCRVLTLTVCNNYGSFFHPHRNIKFMYYVGMLPNKENCNAEAEGFRFRMVILSFTIIMTVSRNTMLSSKPIQPKLPHTVKVIPQ